MASIKSRTPDVVFGRRGRRRRWARRLEEKARRQSEVREPEAKVREVLVVAQRAKAPQEGPDAPPSSADPDASPADSSCACARRWGWLTELGAGAADGLGVSAVDAEIRSAARGPGELAVRAAVPEPQVPCRHGPCVVKAPRAEAPAEVQEEEAAGWVQRLVVVDAAGPRGARPGALLPTAAPRYRAPATASRTEPPAERYRFLRRVLRHASPAAAAER